MSILSRLFGSGGKPDRAPEVYKDYRIFPAPQSTQGGFRIGGRIEKDIDGSVRSHDFVRADILQSAEEAERYTILKAQQLIDEQGEAILS
jgi:hypothetical protein